MGPRSESCPAVCCSAWFGLWCQLRLILPAVEGKRPEVVTPVWAMELPERGPHDYLGQQLHPHLQEPALDDPAGTAQNRRFGPARVVRLQHEPRVAGPAEQLPARQ